MKCKKHLESSATCIVRRRVAKGKFNLGETCRDRAHVSQRFLKPMNSGGGVDDTQGESWWFRDLQPDSGAAPPFVTLRRDEAGFPGGDTCTLVIPRVYTRGSRKESTPLKAGYKARSHGCNSNGLRHMKGCFKHAPAHAPQGGALRRNAPKGRAICGAIPMATQS